MSGSAPLLPHAVPFLLLDRVVEIGERSGVFLKLVSAADACIGADGVLAAPSLIEAIAQAGGALLTAQGGRGPAVGMLAAVDDFRVVDEVRVGDTLRIEVELTRTFGRAVVFWGRVLVEGALRAEGRVTLSPPR
jgi:3-hydroxymyristoyl/3-hydroxydecanoyl-(acyl carrier protein) dehydratase